jgi:hypothetical protein
LKRMISSLPCCSWTNKVSPSWEWAHWNDEASLSRHDRHVADSDGVGGGGGGDVPHTISPTTNGRLSTLDWRGRTHGNPWQALEVIGMAERVVVVFKNCSGSIPNGSWRNGIRFSRQDGFRIAPSWHTGFDRPFRLDP